MLILVLNPGGGSTKVAVFSGRREVLSEVVRHSQAELSRYRLVLDQYRLRKQAVDGVLKQAGIDPRSLGAVVSRGGPLLPLPGGVYRTSRRVVTDIRRGRVQTTHPSLLGPLVGHEFSEELGIPAYFVDPESTDEFWSISRVTGLKGVTRKALSHALSCRAVAHNAARRLGKPYSRCNFIVVHLGSGITVAAHVRGRQVDATNANEEGPFSPQRAGTLPTAPLVALCFAGRYTEADVLELLQRRGGLVSHFGTDEIEEVERLVDRGNVQAALVYDALVYRIAREIGAYAVTCKGHVDAVVLTGGMANSKRLVRGLKRWAKHVSTRFFVFPGEAEMAALVGRLMDVFDGHEREKSYEQEVAVRR
ncbi:MAG: butyrate kinase [candidate division WOR-3 bacterium]|nr:MAG: butyrate kinase [candidate division WOR-3 bacterium]